MSTPQRLRLKSHFDEGKTITRLESFLELGICELSARVGELREEGYEVNSVWKKVVNRFGEKIKVKEYRKA